MLQVFFLNMLAVWQRSRKPVTSWYTCLFWYFTSHLNFGVSMTFILWISLSTSVFDPKSCTQFAKYTYIDSKSTPKKEINRRNSSMSFSYIGTGLPWLNQYLARINVLAQGYNAVTLVRLEPMSPRSWVKHSTTEPLGSLCYTCYLSKIVKMT